MGFRYRKRIKLGKGVGLNISKSGITPSIRTKRGTISSRGYTIKTGVKGVSYRKTFTKSKPMGCLGILFLIVSVFTIFRIKK